MTGKTIAVVSERIVLPALLASAGPRAAERTIEFFTAQIRNPNTREAYVGLRR